MTYTDCNHQHTIFPFQERRGEQNEQVYIDNTRVMFKAVMPLCDIVIDFFDELKSITSGYAR